MGRMLQKCVTGSGDMDVILDAPGNIKPVFLRVHFMDGSGTADLTLSVDSANGDEFDTLLYTMLARGLGADANLLFADWELAGKSPWSMLDGDRFRVQWTNPGEITWGLSFGYEMI